MQDAGGGQQATGGGEGCWTYLLAVGKDLVKAAVENTFHAGQFGREGKDRKWGAI